MTALKGNNWVLRCCWSGVLRIQVFCASALIFIREIAAFCFISQAIGEWPVYICSARIGVVFTPPVISLRALFCVVSRAFRVELPAITSTSLPHVITGLTYVLYVLFIVSCVLPHVALASRCMSLCLWLTLLIVFSTWFFHVNLLSMCTPRYFVLSLLGSFRLLIFKSNYRFCDAWRKIGKRSWRHLFPCCFLSPTCLRSLKQCKSYKEEYWELQHLKFR